MKPFIKLQTPTFKNIPDKEETRRFEEKMDKSVHLLDHLGAGYFGSFDQEDPDDLAQVVENALKARYEGWDHITYEVGDDPKGIEEKEIIESISDRVRQHLERTGGNIGHFPYSGERLITSLTDEDTDKRVDIRFDPFKLYWAKANRPGVHTAMRENSPENNPVIIPAVKKPANYRPLTLFAILALVVTTVLYFIVKPMDNVWLLLFVSYLLIASAGGTIASLILLITSEIKRKQIENAPPPRPIEPKFKEVFYTSGFGANREVTIYNEYVFAEEVQELHNYYTFLKLWSENTGRKLPSDTESWISDFYKNIEPFVIKEDT